MTVTALEVCSACLAAGIKEIDHHTCSLCGYMTRYIVHNTRLYFDAGCDCPTGRSEPRFCEWQDAADWINMQSKPEIASKIAAKFGIK